MANPEPPPTRSRPSRRTTRKHQNPPDPPHPPPPMAICLQILLRQLRIYSLMGRFLARTPRLTHRPLRWCTMLVHDAGVRLPGSGGMVSSIPSAGGPAERLSKSEKTGGGSQASPILGMEKSTLPMATSPMAEQIEPGDQVHSTPTGNTTVAGSPWSPTSIDPELQALAWAILPDLAKDLNLNLGLSKHGSGAATSINPETRQQVGGDGAAIEEEGASNVPEDRSCEAQEEERIQLALIQTRFPACQKGKAQAGEEQLGAQATLKSKRSTPFTPLTIEQTPPWGNEDELGDGWEPAKLHRRKKQSSEGLSIQSSIRPRDRL